MAGGERDAVEVPVAVRTSDLPKRTASAVVMLAVVGGALWLGGAWLAGFVYVVALVCYGEFLRLIIKAHFGTPGKAIAVIFGAFYIGGAGLFLSEIGTSFLIEILLGVIATDVGAYFVGRAIGGPKIAPRISPSKTWAGLGGGAALAALALAIEAWPFDGGDSLADAGVPHAAIFGVAIAVCAQTGDFFESWLKRRAGVKDSSNLIPGHGGVFDRVDGLLAVAFVLFLVTRLIGVN